MSSRLPAVPIVADALGHPTEIPRNGIPFPLSDNLSLPGVLELTDSQFANANEKIRQLIAAKGEHYPLNLKKLNGHTLQEAQRLITHCGLWRDAIGGIPNIYHEQGSGRLGHKGVALHMISLPSVVRALLLEHSDLVLYDMKSAFYSSFVSMASAKGISTTFADSYLRNRSDVHSEWARVTGYSDRNGFKPIALSFLTGGTLSSSKMTRSVALIGKDRMEQLGKNSFARALYSEVRKGMAKLVAVHTKETERGNVVTNVLGKELVIANRSEFGKAASHLLVGAEQFAIRTICENAIGLSAIVYDGFVAKPQPTEPLEHLVAESSARHLGFPLKVRLTQTHFYELIPSTLPDPDEF